MRHVESVRNVMPLHAERRGRAGRMVAGLVEGRVEGGVLVVDTVTRLGEAARGAVLVAGSHGGVFAAWCAARAGVHAVLFNDASGGRDQAGIAGLAWLERLGIAAATLAHTSCRIGDGEDAWARGIVTQVNRVADGVGVASGQTARAAARWLADAPQGQAAIPALREARMPVGGFAVPVVATDSASMVEAGDARAIVCTGSHGGVLGGRPETAMRLPVLAAFFNDAGIGIDQAGISRLPHLEARGIAALTVDAASARIGDGMSTLEDGVVSHLNATALAMGAACGMATRDAVGQIAGFLARHPTRTHP